MKKESMFVATVIDNGGLSACIVAGIFYALSLHIRGFDTPVWSVNAPTAVVKVTVNGKGRNRFLFPADKHFTGMTAFDKKCLNGKSIFRSNRPAPVTGKSYYHRYLSETRAKNQAYAFILSQGLLSEFILFSRTRKSDIATVKRRIDLILERVTREVNRDFNAKQSDL